MDSKQPASLSLPQTSALPRSRSQPRSGSYKSARDNTPKLSANQPPHGKIKYHGGLSCAVPSPVSGAWRYRFAQRPGQMDGTKKTKPQLIADLEAANRRLAALEKKPESERRKNRQLRIFVDALPNFGFAFDGDGRILQVLTGGRPSASRELEGRLLEKILPGEDAGELQKWLGRTFDTGEVQDFSVIMAPLAGRRWFKARTSLRKNSDSGGKFVVLLSQEITNEKLAESILDGKQPNPRQDRAALPGQPHGLGDFSEFPNDSLFIIDAQTLRSLYFGGVGATPTGAGPEKVLQEIVDKINQPGFASGIKRDIHRLLRPEGSAPERETGPMAGRKALPALRARIVKTDGQQTVIGLVGALAERARGEEALRESETRNRTIFETARDSIISIDDQGKIESFNPSSEQIFGYRAEEVVGRDVSLLMPENFAHQHKKGLQNFLDGGQPRIIGNNVEVLGKR
ncbi:MAG: PAS domain S-box protein, partial [bacterium]